MRSFGGFLAGALLGALVMAGVLWTLRGTPAEKSVHPVVEMPDKSVARAPVRADRPVRRTEPPAEPQPRAVRTPPPAKRKPVPAPQPTRPHLAPPPPELPVRTAGDIEEMARRNQPQINACYQMALAAAPNARGTVRIRITVSAQGRVKDARITTNSLQSPMMEDCLLREIRAWRFPPAAFEYTGTHTFTFAR